MSSVKKLRVAVNGYGVIGKRVAGAVRLQDDMELIGISDIGTDWRLHAATKQGFRLFGATPADTATMRKSGLSIEGGLDDLIEASDIVVDCTPKRIAAKNVEIYRQRGVKFVLQGGEKHEVTGHSFVAEANFESAVGRDATRAVSCNTPSIVRTLTAPKTGNSRRHQVGGSGYRQARQGVSPGMMSVRWASRSNMPHSTIGLPCLTAAAFIA